MSGYSGNDLGGDTRDNGDGTSTTTDNRGSITHDNGNEGSPDSGVHWGGNGGNDHGQSGSEGSGGGNRDALSASQKQWVDIQNDTQFRKKIEELKDKALKINPNAQFRRLGITASGQMHIDINGLSREQAAEVGLTGITSLELQVQGTSFYSSDGYIDSGHVLGNDFKPEINSDDRPGFWDKRSSGGVNGDKVDVFVPVGLTPTEINGLGLPKTIFDKKLEEATESYTKLREQQKKNNEAESARRKDAQQKENDTNAIKDAIKYTSDFYNAVFEQFGELSKKTAINLAEASKGKTIRNAEEALVAFNHFMGGADKKYGAKDRQAIAKTLESLTHENMARSLAKFSKAFGLTSLTVDLYDMVKEVEKAVETGQWRPAFVKLETMVAGYEATVVTGWAFAIVAGTPVGILGFGLIMAIVSAMVDESLVEQINHSLGL